ncbi:Fcf2 pre-rRNA processing-domain-containing protein [Lipomyces doorenjongii]|uniref:Fcf2 pre-rRNA processing-domain-containing protein n=1 Tax=Lipomyces doorenjongii TaxID=383834 RepID=UPI0034CE679B
MSSASLKNEVERSSGVVTAEEKKDQNLAVEDQHFLALTDDLEEAKSAIEKNGANVVLKRLPKLASSIDSLNYLTKGSGVVRLNSAALVSNMQSSKLAFRKIADPIKIKRENKEAKEATAGEKWFHMPKTELTPTIKRDMQLLRLRNVLDPKRHYRRENEKEVPKYFQTGTIMEGPTEYFSSRLTKKERKQTLADEILANEKAKAYFKRKYDEIQTVKASGGKNFYKSVKRKRNGR